MTNKKGFEFSFALLFAIIVGAAIIFFAIYATSKLIFTEKKIQETEAGKEFGILLNPIETSLEDAKTAKISFSSDTRFVNDCSEAGNFGKQGIRIFIKSSIGSEWASLGGQSNFFNKYIFSASTVEGRNMIVLSKQFRMPFKVADLIFIWSANDKYCFVGAIPSDFENEIKELNLENVEINRTDCANGGKKVCFGPVANAGCNITVNLAAKAVTKDRRTIYYTDEFDYSLLYGAIFADSVIYECQVRRLMHRASELDLLYLDKTDYLSTRGCSSGLKVGLSALANESAEVQSSFGLRQIEAGAKILEGQNDLLSCKLF